MDSIKLNREIAYMGNIGKQRKEFCINYIEHKRVLLNRIEKEIIEQIEGSGKEVTCHKGCSLCCVVYIEANIQECEAIVHYLYQNDHTLSLFLQHYPEWRDKMRQSGDIFKRCQQAIQDKRATGHNTDRQQALADALFFYKMLNIPCPFLYKGICTIYEVRPYTCASHYATTPAQWCSPLNPNQPEIYQTTIQDEVFDLSFYPKNLDNPSVTFMPLTVHEILKGGFSYLSTVTGIKEIAEATGEPEIKATLMKNHDS